MKRLWGQKMKEILLFRLYSIWDARHIGNKINHVVLVTGWLRVYEQLI